MKLLHKAQSSRYFFSNQQNFYMVTQKYRVIRNYCRGFNNLSYKKYTPDSSICIFLLNRTTRQVFVTYLTGALYIHPL